VNRADARDPTARARSIAACGADDGLHVILQRHGEVTDLPLGVEVPLEAWSRIDLVVVHVRNTPGSPTAGLTSPARTRALLTLLANLRAAGARGVERIVVEDVEPTQPHTGVLEAECELYLTPSCAPGTGARDEGPLSAPARDIARALHMSTARR
jgi:hypothetical protein